MKIRHTEPLAHSPVLGREISNRASHLDVLVAAAAVEGVPVHLHQSDLSPVVLAVVAAAVGAVKLQDLHVAALAAGTALRKEGKKGVTTTDADATFPTVEV